MSRYETRFSLREAAAQVLVQRNTQTGVATITLNRPEKLNALTVMMREYLSEQLWALNADDTTRVVLLRGAGRAFAAGHDLDEDWGQKAPGKKRLGVLEHTRYQQEMMGGKTGYGSSLAHFSKILVGQVHGFAYGGIFSLVLQACDIVVAATDARMGSPQVRFTGAGGAGPWLSVGAKVGKWIASSGQPLTGLRAAELGVVYRAVPPEELEATAESLARHIARRPLEELLYSKARIRAAESLLGLDHSAAAISFMFMLKPDPDETNFWKTVNQDGLKAALNEVYNAADTGP